ncbi:MULTISPECIES: hypothetical protein [unclassified Paenibacillus]|uniref:hypothetical protein n=1 Tax=unclassified Paenibacillus TaxID=185978 RepID=UPI0030F9258F
MSVISEKVSFDELLELVADTPVPRIEDSGFYYFQSSLLAASRWAKKHGHISGYLNNWKPLEIVCFDSDIADLFFVQGEGIKQPNNETVWRESHANAQAKGYLAGFWTGERTFDGKKWAYSYVAIKNNEMLL